MGDKPIVHLSVSIDGEPVEWHSPDSPVNVSIPYRPTEEELANAEHIVIWYIDGEGSAVTVPNARYDAETESVRFKTNHFSLYAVAYVDRTIPDSGHAAWAQKAIEVLSAKEIIQLHEGNVFRPKEAITRADFLYALIRTLDLHAVTNGNFEDISEDAYYYEELAAAKELGIALGSGNNQFKPDAPLSRQDMMVMTERALSLLGMLGQQSPVSVLEKFADQSDIASYAVNSAAALVQEGLIVGNDNHKLMPNKLASRAEAAVFLYRLNNQG